MKYLWLAAIMLIAGCSRAEPKLRMVTSVSLAAHPFRLAQELGYTRAQGLRVEIEEMASGARPVQAVLGGSVIVVALGVANTVIVTATGGRLKAFSNMRDGEGTLIVVSPKNAGRIQSLADLKATQPEWAPWEACRTASSPFT